MRLSLGLSGTDTASRLKYMRQIGVDSALIGPPCDPEVGYYEYPVLMDLKAQVPEIAGVARIMREPEAFQKAIDLVPSDYNGLKFCVGCFSEMGADVAKWIRHFGAQNKLFFIDFRNVRGDVNCFNETFPDDGKENMFEIFRAIYESGYEGGVHPDHAMVMDGDTPDARQYWSFAIGHMRGYLEALANGH